MFKELYKYRDLLFMLTFRDIRIRYKQAAMGFLWALFMPIVAVAAGVLIKKAMAVVSGQYVDLLGIVSISVKVLPWTFFISSLRFSVQSLVGNSPLIIELNLLTNERAYLRNQVNKLTNDIARLQDDRIVGRLSAVVQFEIMNDPMIRYYQQRVALLPLRSPPASLSGRQHHHRPG